MIPFLIKLGIYIASLAAILVIINQDAIISALTTTVGSNTSALITSLNTLFGTLASASGFAMGFINNFFSPANKTILVALIVFMLAEPIIKLIIILTQKLIGVIMSYV